MFPEVSSAHLLADPGNRDRLTRAGDRDDGTQAQEYSPPLPPVSHVPLRRATTSTSQSGVTDGPGSPTAGVTDGPGHRRPGVTDGPVPSRTGVRSRGVPGRQRAVRGVAAGLPPSCSVPRRWHAARPDHRTPSTRRIRRPTPRRPGASAGPDPVDPAHPQAQTVLSRPVLGPRSCSADRSASWLSETAHGSVSSQSLRRGREVLDSRCGSGRGSRPCLASYANVVREPGDALRPLRTRRVDPPGPCGRAGSTPQAPADAPGRQGSGLRTRRVGRGPARRRRKGGGIGAVEGHLCVSCHRHSSLGSVP